MTFRKAALSAVLICAAGLVVFLMSQSSAAAAEGIAPDGEDAHEHLNLSPRHGEWVTIKTGGDSISAWVVYPERPDKAPVVIVIHTIAGLTDWPRAVADQLAAEGFIGIAPDLLSGKGPDGTGTPKDRQEAVLLTRSLDPAEVTRRLSAVASFGTSLSAATVKFGTVGYCWGGGVSFDYAAQKPELRAAVVYYGRSPSKDLLAEIQAPVLGLYGGSDARINAGIPAAEAELKRLGKSYEKHIYEGAGHGFLERQEGREGANLAASEQAWPRTIAFLKEHLEP